MPILVLLACGREVERPRAAPAAAPAALEASENLAEDIQDDIAVRAWSAADGKLADLLARLDGVTSSAAVEQHVAEAPTLLGYRSGLDSLMARVAHRDRLGALEAANGLCRVLATIAAGYPAGIPVSVTLLDVGGRDVAYRAEGHRWTEAAQSVAELRRLYRTIHPHVAGRDASLDARVSRELDELDARVRAEDAAAMRAVVNGFLADVDRIEQTY